MSRKRPSPDTPIRRKDGWSCRIRWTDSRTRKVRTLTLYGSTKRKALAAAQDRLDYELEQMQRADAGRASLGVIPTCGAVFEKAVHGWLPNCGSERHQRDIQRMWRTYWAPLVGNLAVDQVQVGHVGQVLARARRLGRASSTCNRILSAGSVILEFAKSLGYMTTNPAQAKGLRTTEVVRDKDVLTADEVTQLIQALPRRWKPLIALMAYTGLRLGEARAIQGADVDLDAGLLTVRRSNDADETKSKRDRRLPIIAPLRAVLEAVPLRRDEPVSRHGYPYKILATASDAAGISKHVHPHLLRHSFGTILVGHGVALNVVQQLMGHTNITTTRRYLHNAVAASDVEAAFRPGVTHRDGEGDTDG